MSTEDILFDEKANEINDCSGVTYTNIPINKFTGIFNNRSNRLFVYVE
jgi:hypothetical protein